jgi:hypothetical protein
MFALVLMALVLDTSLCFQQFARELSSFGSSGGSMWSARRINVTTAVGATIACIIVGGVHHVVLLIAWLTCTSCCWVSCARAHLHVVFFFFVVVKYIISDVVCAWRAAVLWNYDRRVVATLSLFVLGTIGKPRLLFQPQLAIPPLPIGWGAFLILIPCYVGRCQPRPVQTLAWASPLSSVLLSIRRRGPTKRAAARSCVAAAAR